MDSLRGYVRLAKIMIKDYVSQSGELRHVFFLLRKLFLLFVRGKKALEIFRFMLTLTKP